MAAEAELPYEIAATRDTLVALKGRLYAIAAEHGVSRLRVTPEGLLYGTVDHDRPWSGTFAFEAQVAEELGVRVELISDGALDNPANPDEARLEAL